MEKLYLKIAEIVDVKEVSETQQLSSLEEWDSLAVISILSFVDKEYNVQLSTKEIRDCKTVGDIVFLVERKIKK